MAMSPKQERDFRQMYAALARIRGYESPAQLQRGSEREWGLDYAEALGYSYENIQQEAANGLRGVRLPKPPERKEDVKTT